MTFITTWLPKNVFYSGYIGNLPSLILPVRHSKLLLGNPRKMAKNVFWWWLSLGEVLEKNPGGPLNMVGSIHSLARTLSLVNLAHILFTSTVGLYEERATKTLHVRSLSLPYQRRMAGIGRQDLVNPSLGMTPTVDLLSTAFSHYSQCHTTKRDC